MTITIQLQLKQLREFIEGIRETCNNVLQDLNELDKSIDKIQQQIEQEPPSITDLMNRIEQLELKLLEKDIKDTIKNTIKTAPRPSPFWDYPKDGIYDNSCSVCGIKGAWGLVCTRSDCPTKVTCGTPPPRLSSTIDAQGTSGCKISHEIKK